MPVKFTIPGIGGVEYTVPEIGIGIVKHLSFALVAVCIALSSGCVVDTEPLTLSSKGRVETAPIMDASLDTVVVEPAGGLAGLLGQPPVPSEKFRQAIETEIGHANIFKGNSARKVRLSAVQVYAQNPSGLNFQTEPVIVDLTIRYQLTGSDDEILFSEDVTSRGTDMTFSISIEPPFFRARAKAIRNNISSFIRQLREKLPVYLTEKKLRREMLEVMQDDLAPEDSVYRVIDAEAVVRAFPNNGGKVVKRIERGGIVQVVGRLPNGWLQVAREGNPIGWVHGVSLREERMEGRPTTSQTVSEAAKDSADWEGIKYSNRVSDFQRYLEKHPNGMFVKLAESQMRDLIRRQADPDSVKSQFAGIDFGTYHALVIGINDYKNLPKLKTAVNDAKAVAAMLEKDYGFKVTRLINPDRADIVDAFDEYRESLSGNDNLLIYYAGHGWLDEETGEGYWLTRSAKKNRRSRWISNATITNTLKALSAKHVMVVADSCYSGTLTRSAAIGFRDKNFYKRMASKKARVALVSGGLEPVADDSGKGNSPFAAAFLEALRNNADVLDGTRLFSEIRRPVIFNAKQTPEYSDVRNAGHGGGDFLFVRKK